METMARALAMLVALSWAALGCLRGSAAPRPAVQVSPVTAERSLFAEPWIWSDETGAPVRLDQWRGRFVVVTLVYTSCTSTCPLTIEKLLRIDKRLRTEGRSAAFVLVTLDPASDTPAELQRFKTAHHLPAEWRLLRGGREQTLRLADLLRVRIIDMADEVHIFHDSRVVLLDPDGRILGEVQS